MDLNKDNRNIYTVDAESYSEYMHDNWSKPTDYLSSFIKLLLVILLLVVAYFFYKIIKADLSFSEVFNKQELVSTYELFNNNDKPKYAVEKEDVDVLAKKTPTDLEESQQVVLGVTKMYDEPITVKKEVVETHKVEEILVEDEIKITKIEPVELDVQKEIVAVPTIEVMTSKEETNTTLLSESYLERMVKELNSL